jgi:RNA polymerase sigma-70 factor (ECF subfamily)
VAGDLVAETFAQVIVSAKKFRGGDDEAASAWIDGIARNLLRHFRRRGAVEARARRTLGIEVAVRSALAAAPTVEADDVASSALLRLPASEKEAITLRVLEGMSYQEIGAALNTNAVAVRQRVSRGLRTLRTQLQREEQ